MIGAPVITIDGPSGSGKGTVSRLVARALGWHLLDSGALYRLTGLAGALAGLAPGDEEAHARAALAMDVRFGADAAGEPTVLLDGRDVTQAIRTEAAGERASQVASFKAVRHALLERQRRFAEPPGLVADGRDMGSVIFPSAPLKVFLTASVEERAARRFRQLKSAGINAILAAVTADIASRDARDSGRAVAPLVAAADAVTLDTTRLDAESAARQILARAAERGLDRPGSGFRPL